MPSSGNSASKCAEKGCLLANDLPNAVPPVDQVPGYPPSLIDAQALDPQVVAAPETPPPAVPLGRVTREPTTLRERWLSLDPAFRAHIDSIADELRAKGYDPIIASAWRSPAAQARLYKEGKTQVLFSFHNVTAADGTAAALAVDMVDRKLLWQLSDANAAFFKALGAAAYARGLHWGGGRASGFSLKAPWSRYGLAWDPAHVQALPNRELARLRAAARIG